jgi:hypothetical protein
MELLAENHKTMGVRLITLVRRAKEAGRLREDFEASDMMVLSLAVQAAIAFGGTDYPQLYQRPLGFILDGLSPSRERPTQLAAPALTDAELTEARQL